MLLFYLCWFIMMDCKFKQFCFLGRLSSCSGDQAACAIILESDRGRSVKYYFLISFSGDWVIVPGNPQASWGS